MAIGRISGPMLFSNLERQGLDLAIEGNLLYFDVNRRRIGINTDSPEYDVHITGFANEQANVFIDGSVTASIVTVANAYTLPTEKGRFGTVLTSDGAYGTSWSNAGAANQIDRKTFNYEIANLPAGGVEEFEMDLGIANIVYALTVNRPCVVEVFSTPSKSESNPYTFLATLDHLIDDGSVLLNDGSVIQQRQYSIFANQENPPKSKVYARISNVDGVAGILTLSLTYFAAVTDNAGGVYETNVVDQLPNDGYYGQTLVLSTTGKMYVWYNSTWNPIV